MNKQRNFMRMGALLLTTAAFLAVSASCGGKENDSSGGGSGNAGVDIVDRAVTLTEKDGRLTMENGNVSLTVAKSNGNIESVLYMGKNVELIHGGGANFSLSIDPTTNDVFKANHASGSAVILQSKHFSPEVELIKDGQESRIELTYELSYTHNAAEVSGIRVVNTLSLERKSMYFTSDYEIENGASSDCVVVNFTGAQMSGLKDETGSEAWSLFYPYKEGKLYDGVISRINEGLGVGTKMTAAYPSPMSMQLLQLYNGNASFDYSVLDSEGVYKEFNFGKFTGNKDYDSDSEVGNQISMSCTQFPYVKKGDEAKLSAYRIGTGGEGSWYEGADRYREFLISSGMTKEKNSLTKEWTGMANLTAQGNTGSVFATYESSPAAVSNYVDWIAQADSYGIDTLCAIGWNEGGFDHNYPDYEFSGIQGGESSFTGMVSSLHNNGDAIICYLNAHLADEESRFASEASAVTPSLDKMYAGAIKKAGFEYGKTPAADYEKYMYYESYAGGLSAYAMSPASKDFQDAILSAVKRLAEKGVNGIWFDQLMEMPAYLDYDSSHGAKNPATAYSEGYGKLLAECVAVMEEASDGNCIFVCEGVCDAYIRYIDCCGMMWARKLGSNDTTMMNDKIAWRPEITRYTMPALMLGLEGAGTTLGSPNEFARAFVLGEPLLASNYQDSITKIVGIYNSAKSIYFQGRYMDARGLRVGSEDIVASLIAGSDGSIGLQIYNDGREELSGVKVIIDPSRLGLEGKKAAKIVDLLTGEEIALGGENTFSVSIKSHAIGAYKITLE